MIEIEHLKKQFGSSVPLKDVNATINTGDVIAVIGPSGTGKSTLLRCINLLETPTDGKILVDGVDVTDPKCDINKIRTKLGMVFQSFNLYEHLTVVENCMLAQIYLLNRSRQEAYDKAMDLLASVGMDSKALQYPSQLSGGQKQRVAIARTLSTDPEIILLDEPTSALDPLTVGEVEAVIKDLAQKGHTMMIVTHSMDFAKSVSNRVFYMDQGEIYEDGTPEQIFDSPMKERTRKFIRRLGCLEIYVEDNLKDLSKNVNDIRSFCQEKKLNQKRFFNACLAFEEGCNVFLNVFCENEKIVHVTLEYDEKTDNLSISFNPYSKRISETLSKEMMESLEDKIVSYYAKAYHKELADDGIGIRYTFDLF